MNYYNKVDLFINTSKLEYNFILLKSFSFKVAFIFYFLFYIFYIYEYMIDQWGKWIHLEYNYFLLIWLSSKLFSVMGFQVKWLSELHSLLGLASAWACLCAFRSSWIGEFNLAPLNSYLTPPYIFVKSKISISLNICWKILKLGKPFKIILYIFLLVF